MTQDHFRQIALGLPGAVEGAHMGHPDFRANGRIFATLSPNGTQGMVKLTPAQQQVFADAHAGVFTPASGAWGRQGCTMVLLERLNEEVLGEAMTLAWQNSAQATRSTRKKPARSRKPATRSRTRKARR
jgi:hypothetical protein